MQIRIQIGTGLKFQNRYIPVIPDDSHGEINDIGNSPGFADFFFQPVILLQHRILCTNGNQYFPESTFCLIVIKIIRKIFAHQRIAIHHIYISVYIMTVIILIIFIIIAVKTSEQIV